MEPPFDGLVWQRIAAFLPYADAAAFACVSRATRAAADADRAGRPEVIRLGAVCVMQPKVIRQDAAVILIYPRRWQPWRAAAARAAAVAAIRWYPRALIVFDDPAGTHSAKFWDSALVAMCEQGRLKGAQRLLAVSSRPFGCGRAALNRACANGHLDVARWLTLTFDLAGAGGGPYGLVASCALRGACRNGHLAVAQWIAATFDADARSFRNCALRNACRYGHLAVAQWLVAHYGLNADDACTRSWSALARACENGHLDVVRWISATFGLAAADDRQTIIEWAMTCACNHGHHNVMKWIYKTYWPEVKPDWIRYRFGGACERGYLDLVKWLGDTWPNCVRPDAVMYLSVACWDGRLAVAQWISATFGLTAVDVRAYRDKPILADACARGWLDVAQWLVEHFGLTADEVGQCSSRNPVVRAWIASVVANGSPRPS